MRYQKLIQPSLVFIAQSKGNLIGLNSLEKRIGKSVDSITHFKNFFQRNEQNFSNKNEIMENQRSIYKYNNLYLINLIYYRQKLIMILINKPHLLFQKISYKKFCMRSFENEEVRLNLILRNQCKKDQAIQIYDNPLKQGQMKQEKYKKNQSKIIFLRSCSKKSRKYNQPIQVNYPSLQIYPNGAHVIYLQRMTRVYEKIHIIINLFIQYYDKKMNQELQNTINDQLSQGDEYFDNGNYQIAISEYIKIMQQHEEKYSSFCERGIYFDELGMDQSDNHNFISQYKIITLSNLAQYLRGKNSFGQLGMACYYLTKTQNAIQHFTQIIQRCPQFKFCYYDRGNAYVLLQQYEQATQDYSNAIKLDKYYAAAYINRGLTLTYLGRAEEALIDYNRAIKINTQDAIAYNNRGNYYFESQKGLLLQEIGARDRALNDFNKAIQIDPQYADALNNRGVLLNCLGRQENALIDYNNSILINPQSALAYNNRGFLLEKLGRTEEALNDYTNAIKITQQDADAYNNRGNLLKKLGKYEEALFDFNLAIEINPKYADAYSNRQLGNLLKDLGRQEEALIDYIQALENNPLHTQSISLLPKDQDDFNFSLGNAFFKLKKFNKALEAYQKLTPSSQLFFSCMDKKALSFLELKQYDKCEKILEQIRSKESQLQIYNRLGNIYSDMNLFSKAINMYNRAINHDNKYFHAYNNKGLTLMKTQQIEQALSNFNKAIKLNKKFSEAYNNKGIGLQKLKKFNEAIKNYNRAISINPNKSEYYNNKANVLGGLRQYEDAIGLYCKAIKLNPDDDVAKQNQNKLILRLQKQN
ncbi:hypothetical protein pb186bvf_010479 [Paramecium bursaria]